MILSSVLALFLGINSCVLSHLLLLLHEQNHCLFKVILFFLQFKKHKCFPKYTFCLCSGFGSLQPAACSKGNGGLICVLFCCLKGTIHVRADTEVWCFLISGIYWLISNDSKWTTDESCMVWGLFYLCLHYSLKSHFRNARRAGRKMGKGGQGCLLTSRSAHACKSFW